jgi:hypothetical protein
MASFVLSISTFLKARGFLIIVTSLVIFLEMYLCIYIYNIYVYIYFFMNMPRLATYKLQPLDKIFTCPLIPITVTKLANWIPITIAVSMKLSGNGSGRRNGS